MARPTITIPGYTVDDQPLTAKASLWSCLVPRYDNPEGFLSFTLSAPLVAFQVWGRNSLSWQEYQEGLAAAKVLAGDLRYSEEFSCPTSWIPFIVKLGLTDIPEYIDHKTFDTVGWDSTKHCLKLNVTATDRSSVGVDKILAIDDSGVRDFHDYSTFMSSQSGGGSASNHNILGLIHPDTQANEPEKGALIYGKGNRWTKLTPPSGDKYVLAIREGRLGWWPIRTTKHLEEGKPWPKLRTINGIPNDGPRYYGYNSKGEGPGFWKWSDVDCQEPPGQPPDGGGGGGGGPPPPEPGTPSSCNCPVLYTLKQSIAYPTIVKDNLGCTILTGARAFYLIEPNQDVSWIDIEVLCPYIHPSARVGIFGFGDEHASVTVNKVTFTQAGAIGIDVTLSLTTNIGSGIEVEGYVYATIMFSLCSDCETTPSPIDEPCTLTANSSMVIKTCMNGTDPNSIPPPQVPDWFPPDQPIDQIPPDQGPGFGPGGGPGGGGQPFGGEGDGNQGGGNDGGGGFPGWGNQNPCEIVVPPGGRIPPNLTGKGLKVVVIEKTITLKLPKPTAYATRTFQPAGNPNNVKVFAVTDFNMGDFTGGYSLRADDHLSLYIHADDYDRNGRSYLNKLGIANSKPDEGIPNQLTYIRYDGVVRKNVIPSSADYVPKLAHLEARAKSIFGHDFELDKLTPFALPAISIDCRIPNKPITFKYKVPIGDNTHLVYYLGYIVKNIGFFIIYNIKGGHRVVLPAGHTGVALLRRTVNRDIPLFTKAGLTGNRTYNIAYGPHGMLNYWCLTSMQDIDTDDEEVPTFDDAADIERIYTYDTPIKKGVVAADPYIVSSATSASSTAFDLLKFSTISVGKVGAMKVEPQLLNVAHHSWPNSLLSINPYTISSIEVHIFWLTSDGIIGSLAPLIYRNDAGVLTKLSTVDDDGNYNWNVLHRMPSMIGLVDSNLFSRRGGDIRSKYYNNDPMYQAWYPSRLSHHANTTNPGANPPAIDFEVPDGFPDWKLEVKIRMRAVVT